MKFSKLFLFIILFSLLLFGLYPQIDLEVSSLFYHDVNGFYLKDNAFFYFINRSLSPLIFIAVISLIGLFIYQKLQNIDFTVLNKKAISFLFVFLLIGPGLITNSIIKKHSGRARPSKMVQFGGSLEFTPFYKVADNCSKNCSFISGHVAGSIFFIAFAFLYRSRKIFYTALGFAILMSVSRVVVGKHFFSDVVFALIINFAVFQVIYFLFYKENPSLNKELG